MTDLLKLIQEFLPVPILLGLIFIVAAGWVVRQARGYEANRPLFFDRIFISIVVITIVSLAVFYVHDFVKKHRPDIRFSESEFGVYVFPFANDPDNKITKVFAAALGATLKPPKERVINVFVSDLEPPYLHELPDFLDRRNAALIIHGTVLPDEKKCYLKLLKEGTETWESLRQPINVAAPKELVKAVNFEVLREPSIPSSIIVDRVQKLRDSVASLSFQVRESTQRINSNSRSQK